MNYELVISPEATIEMHQAFEWHENRKEGEGYDLIGEIEEGFERICKHPHHYSSINEKFRKLRINRFPYLIVFELEASMVTIIAFRGVRQDSRF